MPNERNPLRIQLRLPRPARSSMADLGQIHVKTAGGGLVPLAELGQWKEQPVDQTIYHKDLEPIVYIYGETAGRAPADCIVDIQADRRQAAPGESVSRGWVADVAPRPVDSRTFLSNGSGIHWQVPEGLRVNFAGEGEWQVTLDVFRDLGLAFGARRSAFTYSWSRDAVFRYSSRSDAPFR